MKLSWVAVVCLISLLPAARAQQEADEKYIAIYGVVQQAESQAETGEPQTALANLTEAQAQLQQFQKAYPDWNPAIINYRLEDLGKKIVALNARLAAATAPRPARAGPGRADPSHPVRQGFDRGGEPAGAVAVRAGGESGVAGQTQGGAGHPAGGD